MNFLSRWSERKRVDRELAAEMTAHMEEQAAELVDAGVPVTEAQLRARQRFGNLTIQLEESREAWGWTAAEQLWRDLHYGARVLAGSPAVTLTSIIILALGIGMTTAIFSVVKAVLLSSLPYPEPDRIVQMWQTSHDGHLMNVSGPDFADWRDQTRTLEHSATFDADQVSLAGAFVPRRIRMAVVSAGFFEALATEPMYGRAFSAAERKPGGGSPTVVLGYTLAQALFGPGPGWRGKTVRMDGLAFSVIGVMPPRFDFPDKAEAWIPQEFFGDTSARSAHNFHALARLKPATSFTQAQADMNLVAARLAKAYADDKDEGIKLVPLYDQIVGPVRPALLVLLTAVTLVLLIACVNISNLQLARATARVQEFTLRSALGAGRVRLVRQVLTESLLLSLAGGSLGCFLAFAAVAVLRRAAPPEIPRLENAGLDLGMLLFTASMSVLTGLLSGALPALFGSKSEINDGLKSGFGRTTRSRALSRCSNLLVVTQIGLAMVLLMCAALLTKSYWKLSHVDPGLAVDNVFAADIAWPTTDGNTAASPQIATRAAAMLTQIRALPGVSAASIIQTLPVRSSGSDGSFEIEGKALPKDPHDAPDAYYRLATDGYFPTFAIPLMRGRDFGTADQRSSQQVAIVNESFVREFFPHTDALGKRIRFLGFERKPQFMTIVGVVRDARAFGLKQTARSEVFADYFQHPDLPMDATVLVRGPRAQQSAVKSILQSFDPESPVEWQSMRDVIAGTTARERFQTSLLGLFGAVACLLAAVGIYGLLSYTVTRRTREFGVLMALGASRAAVLTSVLKEGAALTFIGISVGVVCALLVTRLLTTFLYGTSPNDPSLYSVVACLFGLAALAGCYGPAHRASRVDPNVALRYE